MKNQVLSIEQMQHLQELGVDTSKASAIIYKISETETYCGYAREVILIEGYVEDYIDKVETFTLQDIIELLPSEIKYIDGELHYLSFSKDGIQYSYQDFEDEWASVTCDSDGMRMYSEPRYYGGESCITFDSPKTLLGCAYEMLCWCAENGYLKGGWK